MIYDTIIVGAGPSGAHLAYLLARAGKRVALIDKSLFPREKLCGGLLTQKTCDILATAYPHIKFATSPINQAYVCFQSNPIVSFRLLSPPNIVARLNFDTQLVDETKLQGVKLFLGNTLESIDLSKHLVILKSGHVLEYVNLVGADGALSRLRNILGLPRNNLGFCVESHVPWRELNECKNIVKNEIAIYYGTYPTGYGWIFPRDDAVVIGVGNLTSGMPEKEIISSFYSFIKRFSHCKIHQYRGAYLPDGSSIRLGLQDYDNLLLIGDAAGLIDPFTGEGIYYALLSAQVAAKAILTEGSSYSKYLQGMEPIVKVIEDTLLMRGKLYSTAMLKAALSAMQAVPQYSEQLINQTILTYEKTYRDAYEEFQSYMG